MKVKVFTLQWNSAGFDDSDVQAFLETRTAIDVTEHFFVHEKTPVLTLVVTYRDGGARKAASHTSNRSKDDPTTDLTSEERQRYEALRTWRNQHARKVGRPPYAVFTNRQAVEIARRRPASRVELGEIAGIGASRIDEFGDELVAVLASMARATSTPPKKPEADRA